VEDIVQRLTGREGGLRKPFTLLKGAKCYIGALITEEPTQLRLRSA